MEAILFQTCKGLNDTGTVLTANVDTKTGDSDLRDSDGVTIDYNGNLISSFGLGLVAELPGNIVALSTNATASSHDRCVLQAGNKLYDWDGSNFTVIQIVVATVLTDVVITGVAKICQTNTDVRYNNNGTVYRIPNHSNIAVLATVGDTSFLPPTSKVYNGMPAFNGGFTANGRLYTWVGDFIQYSEMWAYDVWNLADNHMYMNSEILQAGYIPGCMVIMCAEKFVVLTGTGPHDFVYNEYPTRTKVNTLWSGWADKLGYGHILCSSHGIVIVTQDGKVNHVTETRVENAFDGNFVGASANDAKYIAMGDALNIEYDFVNKCALTTTKPHVDFVTEFQEDFLFAEGNKLYIQTEQVKVHCWLLLPFTDMGSKWNKRINRLYISGEFVGDLTLTVLYKDSDGASKSLDINGIVSDEVITGFGTGKSVYISIQIEFTGTYFYLDSIRCLYTLCA